MNSLFWSFFKKLQVLINVQFKFVYVTAAMETTWSSLLEHVLRELFISCEQQNVSTINLSNGLDEDFLKIEIAGLLWKLW